MPFKQRCNSIYLTEKMMDNVGKTIIGVVVVGGILALLTPVSDPGPIVDTSIPAMKAAPTKPVENEEEPTEDQEGEDAELPDEADDLDEFGEPTISGKSLTDEQNEEKEEDQDREKERPERKREISGPAPAYDGAMPDANGDFQPVRNTRRSSSEDE
jgi:hypothetical protein